MLTFGAAANATGPRLGSAASLPGAFGFAVGFEAFAIVRAALRALETGLGAVFARVMRAIIFNSSGPKTESGLNVALQD